MKLDLEPLDLEPLQLEPLQLKPVDSERDAKKAALRAQMTQPAELPEDTIGKAQMAGAAGMGDALGAPLVTVGRAKESVEAAAEANRGLAMDREERAGMGLAKLVSGVGRVVGGKLTEASRAAETVAASTPGNETVAKVANAVGSGVGSMPFSIVPGVGPVTGVLAAGAQSYEGTRREVSQTLQATGVPEDVADRVGHNLGMSSGLITGTVTAAFNKFGPKFGLGKGVERTLGDAAGREAGKVAAKELLKDSTTKAVLKALFREAAGEGAEEATDQALQEAIVTWQYNPNWSLWDSVKNVAEAGALGAVAGGVVGGGPEVVGTLGERRSARAESATTGTKLDLEPIEPAPVATETDPRQAATDAAMQKADADRRKAEAKPGKGMYRTKEEAEQAAAKAKQSPKPTPPAENAGSGSGEPDAGTDAQPQAQPQPEPAPLQESSKAPTEEPSAPVTAEVQGTTAERDAEAPEVVSSGEQSQPAEQASELQKLETIAETGMANRKQLKRLMELRAKVETEAKQGAETIVSATMQPERGGEVFEGTSHASAYELMAAKYADIAPESAIAGFKTNTGRIVNREEAARIGGLKKRRAESETVLSTEPNQPKGGESNAKEEEGRKEVLTAPKPPEQVTPVPEPASAPEFTPASPEDLGGLRKLAAEVGLPTSNSDKPLVNFVSRWVRKVGSVEDIRADDVPAITEQLRMRPARKAVEAAEKRKAVTYENWAKQYRQAFRDSMQYPPDQVGSSTFTEKMAKLADEHPEFLARLEREEEQAAAAPKPAANPPETPESSPAKVTSQVTPPEQSGKLEANANSSGLSGWTSIDGNPPKALRAEVRELQQKWKDRGVLLHITTNDDSIHLGLIEVSKSNRGSGLGSEALKDVKALADSLNLPVTLTAMADPGRQTDLERFYEANGFVKSGADPFNGKPLYRYNPSPKRLPLTKEATTPRSSNPEADAIIEEAKAIRRQKDAEFARKMSPKPAAPENAQSAPDSANTGAQAKPTPAPLAELRKQITGAVERGEAEPIVERPRPISKGDWISYTDAFGKTRTGMVETVWQKGTFVPGQGASTPVTEYSVTDAKGNYLPSPEAGAKVTRVATPTLETPAAEATKPTTKPSVDPKIEAIRNEREDIKRRLREKLRQTSAGVDPEIAVIAAELAVSYTKEGVVRFSDFAKRVKDELGDIWHQMKPYLRGAWVTASDQVEGTEEVTRDEASKALALLDQQEEAKASLPERMREIILADSDRTAKYHQMRKLADELGISMKEMQEQVESELVKVAHEIAATESDPLAAFDKLVALYNRQPLFSARTSTSVENQAYSTPAPMAYALRHATGLDIHGAVYDPTVGTGMLTIGSDMAASWGNELNELRAKLAKSLGLGTVTTKDATQYVPDRKFPFVHTNPPFGGIPNVNFDGYGIGKLEHLIALKALTAMADNGAAAIILGANREVGDTRKGSQWVFENYLYGHYNVVDNFEADGELYAGQGAKWPVRILIVAGRKLTPEMGEFAPQRVDRLATWADIWNRAEKARNEVERIRNGMVPRGPAELPASAASGTETPVQPGTVSAGGGRGAGKTGRRGGRTGAGGSVGTNPGQPSGGATGVASGEAVSRPQDAAGTAVEPGGNGERTSGVEGGNRGRSKGETDAGTRGDESASRANPRILPQSVAVNDRQTTYVPRSEGNPFGTLTPKSIGAGTHAALDELLGRFGSIDDFVANRLNMTPGELRSVMAADQIDGVALAIDQIETGGALVIGDETGIGKGRQAAAMIRYARLNGMIPLFVTKDPKLFSDMVADLKDINTSVNPLVFGEVSRATIVDQDGTVLVKAPTVARQKAHIAKIEADGMAAAGFDSIFATYSQFNQENHRQKFIEALAERENVVVILDEAHEAAGDGETSMQATFFQGGTVKKGSGAERVEITKPGVLQLPGTKSGRGGVVYLSATFAKRPNNMPLYFRTALSKSATRFSEIVKAMKAGGVALQQAVSEALAKAGQYVRRERDFSGVNYTMLPVKVADEAALVRQVDEITGALQDITSFSGAIAAEVAESTAMSEEQTATTDFAAIVHNQISQLLLSTKIDDVVRMATELHRKGEKPVITLMSTMESFLGYYVEDRGIKPGDSFTLRWNELLKYALSRTLRTSTKLPNGDTVIGTVDLSENPALEAEFNRISEAIDEINVTFPVSPIDAIIQELGAAGIKVGELTGRESGIAYSDRKNGIGKFVKFKKADKNALVNGFNRGDLDGLLLNASGSTGLSIHAAPKFKDTRKRHMLIVQPALDINVFVQTLGRIKRTGMLPGSAEYTHMVMPLMAELRPAAVTNKKMRSLNANTTSEADSSVRINSEDILNKYGDRVVAEYLLSDPKLQRVLRMDVGVKEDGTAEVTEDIARKFTGRLALLPNAVQADIYGDIFKAYRDLVEQLKATGQYDLDIAVHDDWDGVMVSDQVLKPGTNEDLLFTSSIRVQQWEITDNRPVPTGEEMKAEFEKNTGGREALLAKWGDLRSAVDSRLEAAIKVQLETIERLQGSEEPRDVLVRTEAEQTRDALVKKQAAWGATSDMVNRTLARAGSVVSLENGETQESWDGMLVGVKFPDLSKSFRTASSTFQFRYMVNAPGGRMYVSGSQMGASFFQSPSYRQLSEFQGSRGGGRYTRNIIVGNPIGAYEATGGRGKVVRFKSRTGETLTGLLMPTNWTVGQLAVDPRKQLINGDAVANFLATQQWGSVVPVETADSAFRIIKTNYGEFRVVAASAKRTGGQYYLDGDIRELTGDFTKTGNLFEVYVTADKIPAIANRAMMVSGKALQAATLSEPIMQRVAEANQKAAPAKIASEAKSPDAKPEPNPIPKLSGGMSADSITPERAEQIRRQTEQGGFITPPDLSVLVDYGRRVASVLGDAGRRFTSWSAEMLRRLGKGVESLLGSIWSRMRARDLAASAGLTPEAQAALNRIDAHANEATDLKPQAPPVYDADKIEKWWTKLMNEGARIRFFGSDRLLAAKRGLELETAYQAAAVKKQAQRLADRLFESAYANDPKAQRFPRWFAKTIPPERMRRFLRYALPIAAHLNVTGGSPGAWTFGDFDMRAGFLTERAAADEGVTTGGTVFRANPLTGEVEELRVGDRLKLENGRRGFQLLRPLDANLQAQIYEQAKAEFPEFTWLLDQYVDPALASAREEINGISLPVFNRMALAQAYSEADPTFKAREAYTPDVSVAGAWGAAVRYVAERGGNIGAALNRGVRSPGRKYDTGEARERGVTKDLISGFAARSFQVLQERERKQWREAVFREAVPQPNGVLPEGWASLDTEFGRLWDALKRVQSFDDPVNFPQTTDRLRDDESPEYKAFFGELMRLKGQQLMIPKALVDSLVTDAIGTKQEGVGIQLANWWAKNWKAGLLLMPDTFIENRTDNYLRFLMAAQRQFIAAALQGGNRLAFRQARKLAAGAFANVVPGFRQAFNLNRNRLFNQFVEDVMPKEVFGGQTRLVDLGLEGDTPLEKLKRGEVGPAILEATGYGNIDVAAKQQFAWTLLQAKAELEARSNGLRGEEAEAYIAAWLLNPPQEDRLSAVSAANTALLNYGDTPHWLAKFARNPIGNTLVAFPLYRYHFIGREIDRATGAFRAFYQMAIRGKSLTPAQRTAALADSIAYVTLPAMGYGVAKVLGALADSVIRDRLPDDDDEDPREFVGSSERLDVSADGKVTRKPLPRELITANRLNLSAIARLAGAETGPDDLWWHYKDYPLVRSAALFYQATEDARAKGVGEGTKTLFQGMSEMLGSLAGTGQGIKVPARLVDEMKGQENGTGTLSRVVDPYGARVPLSAYLTLQALNLVPFNRQADEVLKWLDPTRRRITESKTLGYSPGVSEAVRLGGVTGLGAQLLGQREDLPASGPINRKFGFVERPTEFSLAARIAAALGQNVKPVNRDEYREALAE